MNNEFYDLLTKNETLLVIVNRSGLKPHGLQAKYIIVSHNDVSKQVVMLFRNKRMSDSINRAHSVTPTPLPRFLLGAPLLSDLLKHQSIP